MTNTLCPIHTRAFESLKDAFVGWTRGYGVLTKDDFLRRVMNLPETGDKVKDVAKFLAEDLSRWT